MDAFEGFKREITGLDGKKIEIVKKTLVQPGSEIRVAGEGMPISKLPGKRGDLLVNVKVVLPVIDAEGLRVLKGVIA